MIVPKGAIFVVFGTRPEIIKLSPVIKEFEKRNVRFKTVHTGQHYSFNMDRIFFDDFELRDPDYILGVGSGTHAKQTGQILIRIEKIFLKEKPCIVVVEGDTNSVLATALGATKLGIKVAHIEAGLRSFDREMPEEINRILTDHISDYLFAATRPAKENLLREGISGKQIFITGNTIVDATLGNIEVAQKRSAILSKLKLSRGNYFLLTLHRQENVDNREKLEGIILSIKELCRKYLIVFPAHPRTTKKLKEFDLMEKTRKIENLKITEPAGYYDFLNLEANAKLILTDSGGIQEEASILKVPCVTLRDNTERPETVEIGANVIAGTERNFICSAVEKMLKKEKIWKHPFGDGKTARKIVDILMKKSS